MFISGGPWRYTTIHGSTMARELTRAVSTRNARLPSILVSMARPRLYEEKRVPTAVRIPETLHRRLQAAAEEREISVNLLIVKAIKKHLDQLPPVDELLTDKSA